MARVGVYIDGFNLYYGGRSQFGNQSGVVGWRWLDIRSLCTTLANEPVAQLANPSIARVVYCTARISGNDNPSGAQSQDVYLRALERTGSVDVIEYGYYKSLVKKRPMALADKKGRPKLVKPNWPIKIKDGTGSNDENATFMVSVADREEKGSDVNVAARLLADIYRGVVNAALVISNDSDLALPVRMARELVPVGTINPSSNYPAGALNGRPSVGVGGHWWRQLTAADFTAHQLPDPAGGQVKPLDW